MKLAVVTVVVVSAVVIWTNDAYVPHHITAPFMQQRQRQKRKKFPCFLSNISHSASNTIEQSSSSDLDSEFRSQQKEALLSLIGSKSSSSGYDPVLACPITKRPLRVSTLGPILPSSSSLKVTLRTSPNSSLVYTGRTDTFLNLLEPDSAKTSSALKKKGGNNKNPLNFLGPVIPVRLRSLFYLDDNYIPMRDLFTSPTVSIAYQRGWRQSFDRAGFPGMEQEYELAREFFIPVISRNNSTTVVDMSCATGFTARRLAKSNDFTRVIACDYSEAMLQEAVRRNRSDRDLSQTKTRLDLVQCDVGNIPMRTGSIDALHAGAAMHCWPDLDAAMSEIYRILKPKGGRYFATTFLASYFRQILPRNGGREGNTEKQAFQFFENVDVLRNLLVKAGFEEDKVWIEVLGTACVVVRAEK